MTRFDEALTFTLDELRKMPPGVAAASRVPTEVLKRLTTAPAAPVSTSDVSDLSDQPAPLKALRLEAMACTGSEHLAASRTQVVFGVGNPCARLMFVGEAPGADDDAIGEPFVGEAGELLTKIIQAMGFTREMIYIANIITCLPDTAGGATAGNRPPTNAETTASFPSLRQQIDLIKPEAIVALGATAMHGLFNDDRPMHQLRGRWHQLDDIPVMATYHPSYLLTNPSITEKRKVWEDMLLVLEKLGEPISEKQRGFFLQKAS